MRQVAHWFALTFTNRSRVRHQLNTLVIGAAYDSAPVNPPKTID